MGNRTSWVYLIVSLSILAFPPWVLWYYKSAPLTHGMVDGQYALVSSSFDVMVKNIFYALAIIATFMLIISWLRFESINLGKYIYLSNASCIGYLGWFAWMHWL